VFLLGATTGTCNAILDGVLSYKVTLSGVSDATVEVFELSECKGADLAQFDLKADGKDLPTLPTTTVVY